MITLKVPDGDMCGDCMFLSADYQHNCAKCDLFGEELLSVLRYGSIDYGRVPKCDRCPTNKKPK